MVKNLVEYIWLDGNNNFRGKTRVIEIVNDITIDDIPEWNYDGSSTYQATGDNSEVLIKPRRIYSYTPLGDFKRFLVICDTWLPNGQPHPSNTRHSASNIFQKKSELIPWFGIEQEFFFIDPKTNLPLGFNSNGSAHPQGQYYCSIGASNCFKRDIADACLKNCLISGLNVTGLNFEVAPGQCEIQLREEGIKAADDLLIMRYLITRTSEEFGVNVDFSAKPVHGDWNGSGCHVNFSTQPMRDENGLIYIMEAIDKLSHNHQTHIKNYGDDNHLRLTGLHETSSIDDFSYGVANRGCSIRIPNETNINKRGYFEDRRPSSSMDPYKVLSLLFGTTSL